MKRAKFLALAVILSVALTSAPVALAEHRVKVKIFEQGELFCPTKTLVAGTVVVEQGRCFKLGVLRDGHGTFLAFLDPTVIIGRSQLVHLNVPARLRIRDRIVALVPIETTQVITLVPLNTLRLVTVRVEEFAPRLILVLTRPIRPRIALIFVTRF